MHVIKDSFHINRFVNINEKTLREITEFYFVSKKKSYVYIERKLTIKQSISFILQVDIYKNFRAKMDLVNGVRLIILKSYFKILFIVMN